jgi:hypothetical protein
VPARHDVPRVEDAQQHVVAGVVVRDAFRGDRLRRVLGVEALVDEGLGAAGDRHQHRREPERPAHRQVEQQAVARADVERPDVVDGVADDADLVVDGELREPRRAGRGERDEQVARCRFVANRSLPMPHRSLARGLARLTRQVVPAEHGTAHVGPRRIAVGSHDDDGSQLARPCLGRHRSEADPGELVDRDEHAGRRALEGVAQLVGAVARVEADDGDAEAGGGGDQLEPLQAVRQPAHDRAFGRRASRRQSGGEAVDPGSESTDRQGAPEAVALARHHVGGPRRRPVSEQRRERRRLSRTSRCPGCRR